MTVERYLSIKVKNWRVSYMNTRKAIIVSAIIIATVFILNFHLSFTVNYEMPINYTFDGGCYSDSIHQKWQEVFITIILS